MRVVQLPRALAAPQEVAAAAVPQAGGGVLAGQRLLVVQQQALQGGGGAGREQERGVGAPVPRASRACQGAGKRPRGKRERLQQVRGQPGVRCGLRRGSACCQAALRGPPQPPSPPAAPPTSCDT